MKPFEPIRITRSLVVGATLVFLLTAPVVRAADDEVANVIARARQFLGGNEALDAVKSLHYKGTVHADDGRSHEIEIIVRRPLQQWVVETQPTRRVTTVLSNYDGWRREERLGSSEAGQETTNAASRVALLNAPDIRRMRANTWQNIYFYQDIDAVGGTITIAGEEEIDGVACVKTVFLHTGNVRFQRFFDKTTGRLVLTRTDEGVESRESGEIIIGGVRFPKELTTTLNGNVSKVVFAEVTVNELVPDSIFETPMPKFSFPVRTPAPPAPEVAPISDTAPTPDAVVTPVSLTPEPAMPAAEIAPKPAPAVEPTPAPVAPPAPAADPAGTVP